MSSSTAGFPEDRATLQNLELLKRQKCEPAVTLDLECAVNWLTGLAGHAHSQQPSAERMLAEDERRATRGAALPCVSVGE
jgi:hypothetical protein